jgi:hypothetical protein
MALSGSVTTGEMEGRSMSLQWTATQDITSNKSTVSWKVVATGSYASGVAVREIKAQINGTNVYYTSNLGQRLSAGTVVASGSTTISHNSDGTGSFTAYIGAAIYYQYTINTEKSASFTLDTIARASSISITDFLVGDVATIKISAATTGFKHTITWGAGSLSGTVASNQTGKTSYTISWDTSGLVDSWAQLIGTATVVSGYVACKTYSGSTLIGTKTVGFKATLKADIVPILGDITLGVDNSDYESIISGWKAEYSGNPLAIVGITKPTLSATAEGTKGSTIKRFEIKEGSSSAVTVSASGTPATLNYTASNPIDLNNFTEISGKNFGKVRYSVTAVDSRLRNAIAGTTLYCYPYSEPKISSCTIERTSADATKVSVNVTWTYSSVNNNNSSSCKLEWREHNASTWNTYSGSTISSGTATTLTTAFSDSKSYEFRVTVTDTLGKTATSTTTIATKEVFLDFGTNGTRLGLGKIVEEGENVFEMHEDWSFKTHGKEILDLIGDTADEKDSTILTNAKAYSDSYEKLFSYTSGYAFYHSFGVTSSTYGTGSWLNFTSTNINVPKSKLGGIYLVTMVATIKGSGDGVATCRFYRGNSAEIATANRSRQTIPLSASVFSTFNVSFFWDSSEGDFSGWPQVYSNVNWTPSSAFVGLIKISDSLTKG